MKRKPRRRLKHPKPSGKGIETSLEILRVCLELKRGVPAHLRRKYSLDDPR
jgi:hypothetical protein